MKVMMLSIQSWPTLGHIKYTDKETEISQSNTRRPFYIISLLFFLMISKSNWMPFYLKDINETILLTDAEVKFTKAMERYWLLPQWDLGQNDP